jgi:hypothetical protein
VCCWLKNIRNWSNSYIGMGQFVSGPENELLSYQFTYQQAAKHADGYALSQLKKIGPVEGRYSCVNDMTVQRKYLSKYGGCGIRRKHSRNSFRSHSSA